MLSRFEYLRPESVASAVELKREHGDGAVYWAGGTDLMLQWKAGAATPSHCIDLTALRELSYIENDPERVRIGALATLAELVRADRADPRLAAIASTAHLMCTVQTRTIATIGGNLCNASPAADLFPPLISMEAVIKAEGPEGAREIPAEDLMVGPGKTALRKGELVREILIPKDGRPQACAYRRIDRTAVDIALVSASSSLTMNEDGTIASARVALGAVAPRVVSSPHAEAMLVGRRLSDLDAAFLEEVGEAASNDTTPISDIRSSAEYRTAMTKVLVGRALDDNRLSLERRLS